MQKNSSIEDTDARRIVVVGGGFGGLEAAKRLTDRRDSADECQVVLISNRNYLLFTSLLPEVATGSLLPEHICAPVRSYAPKVQFVNASVTDIDTGAKRVVFEPVGGERQEWISYDHLLLAAGAQPHFFGLEDVRKHAHTLKNLGDAIALRNHVLKMLERADSTDDTKERKTLLTFVVAGAGLSGVETIGALRDFVHDASRHYPTVNPADARFVLVEMMDRILLEVDEDLADYAHRHLEDSGVEVVLETAVSGADEDSVSFEEADSIPTRTLVWTTGNRPSPLVEKSGCTTNDAGQVVTDTEMRVVGEGEFWAIGDNAAVPVPDSEDTIYPPTAQHATRQGQAVADNILGFMRGSKPEPFDFRSLGTLVALGKKKAVANIRGMRFTGFFAWWLWRTVYLSKLPTLKKKFRVAMDWTLDLFFPRDIVITSGDSDTFLAS